MFHILHIHLPFGLDKLKGIVQKQQYNMPDNCGLNGQTKAKENPVRVNGIHCQNKLVWFLVLITKCTIAVIQMQLQRWGFITTSIHAHIQHTEIHFSQKKTLYALK